jgi:hypothetical protein
LIVVLSPMSTWVNFANSGVTRASAHTTHCTAACHNCSKLSASAGVTRCSTACGVTSAPRCRATSANWSHVGSGRCRNPSTNVDSSDEAVNSRRRLIK